MPQWMTQHTVPPFWKVGHQTHATLYPKRQVGVTAVQIVKDTDGRSFPGSLLDGWHRRA